MILGPIITGENSMVSAGRVLLKTLIIIRYVN